jgi:beta-xylosidase
MTFNFARILTLACILSVASIAATAAAANDGGNDSALAKVRAGNPVFGGWYADPEVVIFDRHYWIYPTYSAPYDQQVFLDAFSSPDLVHWTKHSRILDTNQVTWARRAMWVPAALERNGKYYLFFSANDVHQGEVGGIGVAVADRPEGPFKDLLGKPLINQIVNGAQPIDQFAFKDQDGQDYLIYGGWSHCNIARLKPDFTGLLPFPDGSTLKEITPEHYVEGPFMFRREDKYYFMWSEGGWTGPNYSVAYAIGNSPLGPFKRIGKVLQQDPAIATGAGHHSVLHVPGADRWFIVYHRRPLGDTNANHRVTCIDEMAFDEQGFIKPVRISKEGVEIQPL